MRNSLLRLLCMAVVSGTLLLSGCAEQAPPEGQLVCKDNSDCPSGWVCDPSDAFCYTAIGENGDGGEEDTETE